MTTGTESADYGWLEPVQRPIVPTLRGLLSRIWPIAHVRTLAEQKRVFDPGLLENPSHGALFLPTLSTRPVGDYTVIAAEWGRALCPAMLIDLNITALAVASDPRQAALAASVARGTRLVAWCPTALPGQWGRQSGVAATAEENGFRLNGHVGITQCARQADTLLVPVRDGDRTTQVLLPVTSPGVRVQSRQCLDLTRDLCAVHFDDVHVPQTAILGQRGDAAAQVEHQAQVALVLSAASTVGSMSQLLSQAVSDAKTRTAFGRPIGSFQAVKHQLVDAALALEMSHALVARAAAAVEERSADAAEITSMAKAYVGRAGIDLAHIVWQVLGGKAYMWDNDFHLYLRRITVDASMHGDVN